MRIRLWAMGALVCAHAALGQDVARPNVEPALVCKNQQVDKPSLAAELLDRYGISRRETRWAETAAWRPRSMNAEGYLVQLGKDRCTALEGCRQADALEKVQRDFLAVLKDAANLEGRSGAFELRGAGRIADEASVKRLAGQYFRNPEYQIACIGPGPVTAPAPASTEDAVQALLERVRVRGKASDLYAPKDTAAFKAADKASLSYTQDDVKHKRVRVATGVVGFDVTLAKWPQSPGGGEKGNVDVVPYLGVSSNIAKAAGSDASVTTNTRQAGLAFYGYTNRPLPYYWTLRPQLLWDLTDKSRLLTTDVGYIPIVVDYVNSTREFTSAPGYWWQWIVQGRYAHGHYTRLGTRKREDSGDFDRIGGVVGFELDHASSVLPWSWTVTESYLRGWNGNPRNLSQLKSVLSISWDDKKLFGIDFTYTNGRDPDTTEKDHAWKISLGFKY